MSVIYPYWVVAEREEMSVIYPYWMVAERDKKGRFKPRPRPRIVYVSRKKS